jgi:hypothetical protein
MKGWDRHFLLEFYPPLMAIRSGHASDPPLPAEAEVSVHIYQEYSRVGSGCPTEVLLAKAGRRRRT